jgi:hypothetical protein
MAGQMVDGGMVAVRFVVDAVALAVVVVACAISPIMFFTPFI